MIFNKWQLALAFLPTSLTQSYMRCNPLKIACLPNTAFGVHYIANFTQFSTLHSPWIPEGQGGTIGFDSSGAAITVAKNGDARYMTTVEYFLHGQVEIVAQAAPGAIVTTSVHLISDTDDVISFELSQLNWDQGQTMGTDAEGYHRSGINGSWSFVQIPENPVAAYHTYTVDWTEDLIIWSVNGKNVRTLYSTDYHIPETPMRLRLGVRHENPSDSGPHTAHFQYVRVTPAEYCGSYVYLDQSGRGATIGCMKSPMSFPPPDLPPPLALSSPSAQPSTSTSLPVPSKSSSSLNLPVLTSTLDVSPSSYSVKPPAPPSTLVTSTRSYSINPPASPSTEVASKSSVNGGVYLNTFTLEHPSLSPPHPPTTRPWDTQSITPVGMNPTTTSIHYKTTRTVYSTLTVWVTPEPSFSYIYSRTTDPNLPKVIPCDRPHACD
ncbi:concanavalin A-like lectin/glucanase domain-containing protein [Podospora appendiculata]|uniref:Concanavalin A-like lectin/glucanase domain-containing protein n=1 Tax=Podospora appendiculata TaxID=314037 RepID=A0AAE0XC69_9PEZI|nr:concanavalin A-like lectin/glucanase domain-containing protein [Podospora appendiculata]